MWNQGQFKLRLVASKGLKKGLKMSEKAVKLDYKKEKQCYLANLILHIRLVSSRFAFQIGHSNSGNNSEHFEFQPLAFLYVSEAFSLFLSKLWWAKTGEWGPIFES